MKSKKSSKPREPKVAKPFSPKNAAPMRHLNEVSFTPISAKVTSFATLKDLRGYINCLLGGGGATACYSRGDNGTGAWGDNTAQLDVPMCALPPSEMAKKWGSSNRARGKKIQVSFPFGGMMRSVVCEVRDKGPNGVVDLNPAALQAAGLPTDTELSVRGTWHWL